MSKSLTLTLSEEMGGSSVKTLTVVLDYTLLDDTTCGRRAYLDSVLREMERKFDSGEPTKD